jgi:hypothetical protein
VPWIRGVGGLCVLVGAVWLFQGVGVIPGSFMTGSSFWAITGAIVLAVGILLIVFGRYRGGRTSPSGDKPKTPPD